MAEKDEEIKKLLEKFERELKLANEALSMSFREQKELLIREFEKQKLIEKEEYISRQRSHFA